MVEKLGDVWFTRYLPVLVHVARCIDGGLTGPPNHDQVGRALGMPEETVALAFEALERRGFLVLEHELGGGVWVEDLLGPAYLVTGLHPDGDDLVDRLVSALKKAAEQSTDEDEASGLRKAARGLGEVTKGVATAVISAALTGYIPRQ